MLNVRFRLFRQNHSSQFIHISKITTPSQNRSTVSKGLLCAFLFTYKHIRWTTGEINHYPVRQQGRFENHPLGPVLGHVADIRPDSCGHFCSLIEMRAQRADQRWSFIRAAELKSCPLIKIAAAPALFVVCQSRLVQLVHQGHAST